MQRRTVLAILVILSAAMACQVHAVPTTMSYQGKLTDLTGNPVPNGQHTLVFKLYTVATGGTSFWTTKGTQVTTSGGLFTATIDEISESQFVSRDDVWLEMVVDGGTLSPRVKLASVPYAFRSGDLDVPFTASISTSSCVFSLSNTGSGNALNLQTSGLGKCIYGTATGNGDLVSLSTTGTGRCIVASTNSSGRVIDASTSGTNDCLHAVSTGSGSGDVGYFQLNNATSSGYAIYTSSNSTAGGIYSLASAGGSAVAGFNTGTGYAGDFEVTNAGSSSNAVRAVTYGTAQAVYGSHIASGNYGSLGSALAGVYGSANSTGDYGVYGIANNSAMYGVYGSSAAANSYALYGLGIGNGATGVYARGGAGGFAGVFRGNIQIQDRSTGSSVIELGTGLDYAEGFNVSKAAQAGPGSVLVIDARHAGKLTLSNKAYDKKVAGIVAGAHGLGSGVKLGTGQFDRNVALAGRVYCNVEATAGAVEIGDLLTTSSIPGCAMKAGDYRRAQGAVLGKAMQPLERGKRGQILVLVTLQ